MIGNGDQSRAISGADVSNLAPEIRAAIAQLMRAREYARDVNCDPWEFAVEIERLVATGVTTSDLRWLVKKGFIEHASEVTRASDPVRKFRHGTSLAFGQRSCFFLTDRVATMATADARPVHLSIAPVAATGPGVEEMVAVPRWSKEDRVLYLGRHIVKEYRVPSPNQELVLTAFQEEGWSRYVDDPLPPAADQSPKQRLRDTIRYLNANQKNHLIRFRGDGTGERIRWEVVEDATLGAPEPVTELPATPQPFKRAA